jgi:ketosteroid isomerase-like protein
MGDVEDLIAITAVINRYSRAMDTRQWHLMDEVFTDDAIQEINGVVVPRGRQQIIDTIRAAVECCERTHHMNTNIDVTIAGDTATGVCLFRAWHRGAGARSGEIYEAMGTYTDEFVRTGAGWRIHRRVEDIPIDIGSPEIFADAAEALAAVTRPAEQ